MHDWVANLLSLQDLDLRIARLEDQVASVPVDKKQAKSMLDSADQAVADAKAKVMDTEKAIKHVEIDIETVEEKRRDFERKSTMIKDNDEYRMAMKQINHCRQQVADLEDRQLTLMETLEADRRNLDDQTRAHKAARERVRQLAADLDTRLQNCEAELEKLRAQRAKLRQTVDSTIVARYERICRNRRGNGSPPVGFAPVRDYTCGWCHMNVPPQVRMNAIKGQMASCPQCNVLLYVED